MNIKSGSHNIIYGLASLTLIVLISCNTETVDPEILDKGYDYYPLEIGNYKEYEVIDVQYEVSNERDSAFYFLKEVVEDTFINQNQELTYLIKQYRRYSDTVSWKNGPVKTRLAVRSETNLIVYENGIPFVKLVFPVEEGLSWNGNAFNHIDMNADDKADDDPYTYLNVNDSFILNDTLWNTTLTVEQNNEISLVKKDSRYEIYGRGAGLIYKEFIRFNYVDDRGDPLYGKNVIQSGEKFIQTLIDYGKE